VITTYCFDKSWAVFQKINSDGTIEPYSWEYTYEPNSLAESLYERYRRLTEDDKAAFRKLLDSQNHLD
jgi:hypothetical protein